MVAEVDVVRRQVPEAATCGAMAVAARCRLASRSRSRACWTCQHTNARGTGEEHEHGGHEPATSRAGGGRARRAADPAQRPPRGSAGGVQGDSPPRAAWRWCRRRRACRSSPGVQRRGRRSRRCPGRSHRPRPRRGSGNGSRPSHAGHQQMEDVELARREVDRPTPGRATWCATGSRVRSPTTRSMAGRDWDGYGDTGPQARQQLLEPIGLRGSRPHRLPDRRRGPGSCRGR